MKTKLKKIMKWVYSNLLWIIIIAGIGLYFISPIVSAIGVGLIFLSALYYIIYKHVNEPKKEISKDISEPPVTEWIVINNRDGKKYRLSIFYDDNSETYRILDMNNQIIFCGDFETEHEAKEHMKNEYEELIGLKCYNCI